MRPLAAAWLGRVPYGPATALQERTAARRAAGEVPDTLLLLEHEPVYTLGRRASESDILFDANARAARGIVVERSDRGGRVTYHGPGQLVGYPIVSLGPSADLVAYVRALERALIGLCAEFGVCAHTVEGLTGVWVGREKIAAIGIHVSQGITTHGFAVNVTTDLEAFSGIVPCGIVDRGVTSLEALTGRRPAVADVARIAAGFVADALTRRLLFVDSPALGFAGQVEAHA